MLKNKRLLSRLAFGLMLLSGIQSWANPPTLSPIEKSVKPSETVFYHCKGNVTNYESSIKSESFEIDEFVTLCSYSCSHQLNSTAAAGTSFTMAIVDHGPGNTMEVEVSFPHSVRTTMNLASDTKYFNISTHNIGDPVLVQAQISCEKN